MKPIKPQMKKMSCLKGTHSNCLGTFLTTKENRICSLCQRENDSNSEAKERKPDIRLINFWKGLK